MGRLLSKLESAKNSLFQSVNEVLAVKSAKETMSLRSQSENFGTVAPSCLQWTSLAHSHKHTYMYIYSYLYSEEKLILFYQSCMLLARLVFCSLMIQDGNSGISLIF